MHLSPIRLLKQKPILEMEITQCWTRELMQELNYADRRRSRVKFYVCAAGVFHV